MSVFVKICGIRDPATARVAHDSGADAIGLVFADSVRRVTTEEARAVIEAVPSSMLTVAVFRRPSQAAVDGVIGALQIDMVQADFDSPMIVPRSVEFLPVYHDGDEIGHLPPRLMYESRRSGEGDLADWGTARALGVSGGEVILAGGLDAGNVARAIAEVAPFGVDVSSGVESSPGVKDHELIASFVSAARSAGESLRPASHQLRPETARRQSM